ncbi:MAG: hypothetical protein WD557_04480 [Dehalococcoidia bacterium]
MADPTSLRGTVRAALLDLHQNRQQSPEFARALGMRAISNPTNLAGDPSSEVAQALEGKVSEFYRVGEASLGGATAGLYLAYLDQWSDRSAEREPYRRRVAKVLVERMANDGRWMCVLLDHGAQTNAEVILPRRREGAPPGTVRAMVNLKDPTHFHLSLLADLDTGRATSLAQLSRQWNEAFSVENVTKKFHEDFRKLRDRLVLALVHSNPDNSAIAGRLVQLPAGSNKDRATQDAAILRDIPLLACGTRQLGRMLFLWFLQQKRWFGASMGAGSTEYLLDLFRDHAGTLDYFNDVLVPIFFDALGHSAGDTHFKPRQELVRKFGRIPYLGGGLFRPDPFEEELFGIAQGSDDRTRRVTMVTIP